MTVPTNSREGLERLCVIDADLAVVEEVISTELTSEIKTVTAVGKHLLEAGGKRLRPALVLLCARSTSPKHETGRAVNVAASVELIHTATLVHDDVIDESNTRRGRKTANSVWGNRVSVLVGDYMLARAFLLLAREGNARIMKELSRATVAMAEGEIVEIETKGRVDSSDAYLHIIRCKTAEFMSACCRIGAILADAPPDIENALARYGLNMGMAFQITDDLLDLVGDPAVTGKPIGSDLREGKATMPIILTMSVSEPADRRAIERIFDSGSVLPEDVEFVRRLALSSGSVAETRRLAAEYVEFAVGQLQLLPISEARLALEDLARYTLNRTS